MRVARCKLSSAGPYSQSRPLPPPDDPALANLTLDEIDGRVWRQRMHVNETGFVFIPPMSFTNSLKEAAQYLSLSVPGKGSAKYTKHFASGVLVSEPLVLSIKALDVVCERLFVPSDGKRGGGKRVWRHFPLIEQWAGAVTYHVFDESITEEVFERVLRAAGQFIGIGRFRPKNWGYYGRYSLEGMTWKNA